MAEGNISEDKFNCSVCLDLLKDPVTIPCGHSYCMSCITNYWNQEDQKRIYSCPQCRQTFTSRPALNKNVMIAEMVEELKKTRLQTDVSDQCYAGPEDVKCDVCTEGKYKAVKSCLECLNSYCQNHLQQHEQFFHVNKHNLMDPRTLNEMICSKHRKHLEIYCRTDQKCICYPCLMDEHKDHDTVTAVDERTEKQRVLGEKQRNLKQRIQEREKKLQELKGTVNSYKRSAQTAVKDSKRIFTELIRSIERRRSEVTQLIRDQEKTAVSRAEGVLKRLEQEIEDLRRRDTELEQLLHTDNHIHFLKSFQCLSASPESTVSHNNTVSSLVSFDDVKRSLSQLKEKLEDFCKEKIKNISDQVSYITTVSDELKTREEFLQYFSQFTLDSNTVNKYICLSDGNTTATNTGKVEQYPDHPERFDMRLQVLCRESVCERCYWEVEWNGDVYISVSYKSISRKGGGDNCVFGYSDQSWRLRCTELKCSFWQNNKRTDLPVVSSSCRIGVFVDHRAGILSFYSVSDTMTLIHRVRTTFTQPLCPGFYVSKGSRVKVHRLTK